MGKETGVFHFLASFVCSFFLLSSNVSAVSTTAAPVSVALLASEIPEPGNQSSVSRDAFWNRHTSTSSLAEILIQIGVLSMVCKIINKTIKIKNQPELDQPFIEGSVLSKRE